MERIKKVHWKSRNNKGTVDSPVCIPSRSTVASRAAHRITASCQLDRPKNCAAFYKYKTTDDVAQHMT